MDAIFFDNWQSIFRTLLIGSLSYIALIFFLRISGKRTLSKMNMFDFIVTVAFGSTLASVILSKKIALAQGVTGLGLLVLLQYIITFIEVRSYWFKKLIKSSPSLIYFKGDYYVETMKKERVTKEEIKAAVREQGYINESCIDAVVLETDGSFAIIKDVPLSYNQLKEEGILIKK